MSSASRLRGSCFLKGKVAFRITRERLDSYIGSAWDLRESMFYACREEVEKEHIPSRTSERLWTPERDSGVIMAIWRSVIVVGVSSGMRQTVIGELIERRPHVGYTDIPEQSHDRA